VKAKPKETAMLVSQIIKSKAMEGVLTLTSEASVSDAAAIMSDKRIGTIVISDDGGKTAAGILSERDIVRNLGKMGAACMTQSVGEMMTKKLVTCSPSDGSDAVLATMTDGRFRHMPVIEDGILVGLISIGDAVKARLAELAMERDALEGMVMGH
jgi:CBS domain-containing protein